MRTLLSPSALVRACISTHVGETSSLHVSQFVARQYWRRREATLHRLPAKPYNKEGLIAVDASTHRRTPTLNKR
jgi:hypothetical protein